MERHDVADRGTARQVQIPAVPDDHDVDDAEQQPPRSPQHHLAAVREQLLAQHRVAAAKVPDELAHLAAERADDANARERLADTAIDLLRVLAKRTVDGPHTAGLREAQEHHARNDRERRQRQSPVQRHQHDDRHRETNDRNRRRHDRHLEQPGGRVDVARQPR